MPESDRKLRERMSALRQRALEVDQEPRLLSAAARLRSKLPGDDRYGDTLSLTGRQPHQLLGKGLNTLQAPRESLVAELGRAALQVWQAASEAQGRGRGETELALLFSDLADFSSWALGAGDAVAVELLRAAADVTEGAIRENGGRIIKHLGDGWMATFAHPEQAVSAALVMRAQVESIEAPGYEARTRIGIHWGRPRPVGNDYLGVDVNITARVADAASPGEVLVSDRAAALLGEAKVKLGRAKRLKAQGAPADLRICAVSAL